MYFNGEKMKNFSDSIYLKDIFYSRPFAIRNADEYDIENILDLFIDPTDGLVGPFDFTNSIIKGKMGSGKTMYLRANYAYYLYTVVPCLLDKSDIILPVYIKLSDFQNIHNPDEIYYAIIIKIVEEIVSVMDHLKSADELAKLHKGAHSIGGLWTTDSILSEILEKLKSYTCEEYVKKVSNNLSYGASIAAKYAKLCSDYSKNEVVQIKAKGNPSFDDVVDACKKLLLPFNGKLLILFDEVGSIDKRFFKSTKTCDSLFETLMNQLRTLPYIRTKLAVYPKSQSDILRETRYGDIISLEENITLNDQRYESFLSKTTSLIERYIEKSMGVKINAEYLFDISVENQLLLEQLINASDGNMRRLVHLLDSTMNTAFKRARGESKILLEDVINALKQQGESLESQFGEKDRIFLNNMVNVCKNRKSFKFTFPNKSAIIDKFTSFSNEYNVINIVENGSGRQSTVYSFDYAYCVYKDIPTHFIKDSNKIDKDRSFKTGKAIERISRLSDELIIQSNIPGKITGHVIFLTNKKSGFIRGDNGLEYFFEQSDIIETDKNNQIYEGCEVRFLPLIYSKDMLVAKKIELITQ